MNQRDSVLALLDRYLRGEVTKPELFKSLPTNVQNLAVDFMAACRDSTSADSRIVLVENLKKAIDKSLNEPQEESPDDEGSAEEGEKLAKCSMYKATSALKSILSTEDRADLSKKQFAIPSRAEGEEEKKESGNYPIPDESHARNALARVVQHGTPSEQAQVSRAVDKKYPGLRKSAKAVESRFIREHGTFVTTPYTEVMSCTICCKSIDHDGLCKSCTDTVSVGKNNWHGGHLA